MKTTGQAIVEVILAFAIAVVAIVGLVAVSTKSVSNSSASRRQAEATAYAVAGMEWIRGQKDVEDWGTFYGRIGVYCLNNLSWAAGACSGPMAGTEYRRSVTMSQTAGPPQQSTAVVSVTWYEGSRQVAVTQTSVFTGY